jgi:hypothetical protein
MIGIEEYIKRKISEEMKFTFGKIINLANLKFEIEVSVVFRGENVHLSIIKTEELTYFSIDILELNKMKIIFLVIIREYFGEGGGIESIDKSNLPFKLMIPIIIERFIKTPEFKMHSLYNSYFKKSFSKSVIDGI